MRSLLRFHASLLTVALLLAASAAQAAPAPDEPAVGKIDKYLPDETGGVFVADIKQILASKAFTKELKKQIEDLLKMDQVQMVLNDTGFDPFKDIDRAILAITPGTDGFSGPFLVVEGRFDVAKLTAKADELAKQFPGFKPVEIGKAKVYEMGFGGGNPPYLGFLDKNTVILSSTKQEMTDAVEKAGGKRKTEFKSKTLAKLIDKMDPKLAVNVACAGEMAMGGSVMSVPGGGIVRMVRTLADQGIDSIIGGITVNEEGKAKIHFAAKDADVAKKLAAEFEVGIAQMQKEIAREAVRNEHLTPVLDVVKTIKTSVNDQTLIVEGHGNATAVEALIKAWFFEVGGRAAPTAPPAGK
jgi:hypothetical protein